MMKSKSDPGGVLTPQTTACRVVTFEVSPLDYRGDRPCNNLCGKMNTGLFAAKRGEKGGNTYICVPLQTSSSVSVVYHYRLVLLKTIVNRTKYY